MIDTMVTDILTLVDRENVPSGMDWYEPITGATCPVGQVLLKKNRATIEELQAANHDYDIHYDLLMRASIIWKCYPSDVNEFIETYDDYHANEGKDALTAIVYAGLTCTRQVAG